MKSKFSSLGGFIGWVVWGIGTVGYAHPGERLIRGFVQGAIAGTSNLVILRCIDSQKMDAGDSVSLARDVLTSGMTGLGFFNVSSGVPPAVVMGVGLFGLSFWGNSIAIRQGSAEQRLVMNRESSDPEGDRATSFFISIEGTQGPLILGHPEQSIVCALDPVNPVRLDESKDSENPASETQVPQNSSEEPLR